MSYNRLMSNVQTLKPHNQSRYVCVGCGHEEVKVLTLDGERLKMCPECKFTAMLPSDALPMEVLQTRLNFVTITSDHVISKLREVIESQKEEIAGLKEELSSGQ